MQDSPSLGNMRRRLTVQFKTTSQDGAGGQVVTWATQATIWAEVNPTKADEKNIGAKLTHVVTHNIKTRYRTDINVTMRIIYGTRIFEIHGVQIMEEKQKYLLLSCQEGVGS